MSKFKLIEGSFTVAEAKEVVLALLQYKINFHSNESFSSEIRNGHANERSLKRKEELRKTREAFLETVSGMDPESMVTITADIIMT